MSAKSAPPKRWSDLPFNLPPDEATRGTVLALPSGRVLVRTYDTYATFEALSESSPEGRYDLDISDVRFHDGDEAGLPQVDDTMFYLGEVETDAEPSLWAPQRVVFVDDEIRVKPGSHSGGSARYVRVWSIRDYDLDSPRLTGELSVPRRLLATEWELISDLVVAGRSATNHEAHQLLDVFDCAWVLDRP